MGPGNIFRAPFFIPKVQRFSVQRLAFDRWLLASGYLLGIFYMEHETRNP
jgi:hypothetical protein